jgi:hypothetical protein
VSALGEPGEGSDLLWADKKHQVGLIRKDCLSMPIQSRRELWTPACLCIIPGN